MVCGLIFLLIPILGNICGTYSDFNGFCATIWRNGPFIVTDDVWDNYDGSGWIESP